MIYILIILTYALFMMLTYNIFLYYCISSIFLYCTDKAVAPERKLHLFCASFIGHQIADPSTQCLTTKNNFKILTRTIRLVKSFSL